MLNKKNVAIVVQARMGSSRLPGKVLMQIHGKPMMQVILESLSIFGSQLIVATTVEQRDDTLAEYCETLGVKVFRGDEANVLSRFQNIPYEPDVSHVVRLCADSPFISSDLVMRVLRECNVIGDEVDLFSTRRILSNGIVENFSAKGLSVDVIRKGALFSLDIGSLSAYDCEHVIPAFFKGPFTTQLVKLPLKSDSCFAVDTEEDFKFVNNCYEDLLRRSREITNAK